MNAVEKLGPREMRGRFVVLEPLEERHHAALAATAEDPEIWRYIPFDAKLGFAPRLAWLVHEMSKGSQISFAVRRLSDDRIVGSTSYLAITQRDAKVEIGSTWYTADAQGGAVNPEAKYLLLSNAFACNYNRVEFKTDSKNARSRAALAKLGAKEEGILRGHMWMPQGYYRDSVYFSILAAEWPQVRAALEARLNAFSA